MLALQGYLSPPRIKSDILSRVAKLNFSQSFDDRYLLNPFGVFMKRVFFSLMLIVLSGEVSSQTKDCEVVGPVTQETIEMCMIVQELNNQQQVKLDLDEKALKEHQKDIANAFSKKLNTEVKPNEVVPTTLELDPVNPKPKLKGKLYISWGYHKGFIQKGDIRFWNPNGEYDFVAHNVQGYDSPRLDAIFPKKNVPYSFDVPQYQIKIGYNISDKWAIEVSQEHAKYFMVKKEIDSEGKGQTVKVTGNFFGEELNNENKKIATYDTIVMEHSDGQNMIRLGLVRNFPLVASKNSRLSAQIKGSVGLVVPATASYVKNEGRDDKFSIVGHTEGIEARLRYIFLNNFYIQTGVAADHTNIIKAKLANQGHASHQIYGCRLFAEFGVEFNVKPNSKKKERNIK